MSKAIFRARLKPLECSPVEATPITRSSGSIARPSITRSFSATPTQKPARS